VEVRVFSTAPEYQEVAEIRRRCAESTIIIVEGVE
jgi:uncharacterized protein (DUF1330 family)